MDDDFWKEAGKAIEAQVKELAEKAKNKKLQPNEFEGNTFTISNLGMFGIDEFTAIINSPDACILAVGAAKETVIVENGQMKIANVMKVTLSCDHRVVDGAVGSAFLKTLKELLEMREALQVIFNSKTTTPFAFKILNLLTEYDAILKKIELMHNKLNKEYSEEEFQKEMQHFLTTTVAFNSTIATEELLKENISITPFELWTIKKIMVA
jgi:hypothetical protein